MKFTRLTSAVLAIVLVLFCLPACSQEVAYADTVFVGMDTVITLRLAKKA